MLHALLISVVKEIDMHTENQHLSVIMYLVIDVNEIPQLFGKDSPTVIQRKFPARNHNFEWLLEIDCSPLKKS